MIAVLRCGGQESTTARRLRGQVTGEGLVTDTAARRWEQELKARQLGAAILWRDKRQRRNTATQTEGESLRLAFISIDTIVGYHVHAPTQSPGNSLSQVVGLFSEVVRLHCQLGHLTAQQAT